MDADQNQRPADASITGGATQTTPENKKTAGEKETDLNKEESSSGVTPAIVRCRKSRKEFVVHSPSDNLDKMSPCSKLLLAGDSSMPRIKKQIEKKKTTQSKSLNRSKQHKRQKERVEEFSLTESSPKSVQKSMSLQENLTAAAGESSKNKELTSKEEEERKPGSSKEA